MMVGGLAAGITVAAGVPPKIAALVVVGGGISITRRRAPLLRLAGGTLIAAALGATAARHWVPEQTVLGSLARAVPACRLSGRVLEHAGGLGTLVSIDRARCEGSPSVADAGVVVTDLLDAAPGALLAGRGLLLPLRAEGFDGARRRLGAHAAAHLSSVTFGDVAPGPLRAAESIRKSLRKSVSSLERQRAALVLGLTIGDTTELTRDTTEELRRAGLSHLLAVSGSNVAIVLGAVMLIGRGLSLVWRIVLGTVSLTGLVLTVGPDPSVLRAAAMGIVALAALGCGRRTEPIQTLGVALIGLLAARPTLLYSVGLHLSVAASAGIVLWAQPLARRLKRLPSAVAAVLSVTLAAQAAVAPVVIGTFGELSLVAPVANLLALPAVPPATILAVSAGVVGLVDGRSAAVLGGLTEPFAAWILVVGHTTASPGWAALEVARSTAVLVALPVVVLMMASLRRILRGRDNPVVASWRWTVHDVTGRDIAVSEEFDSKQDAEAWMGREWASLRDQGGESVSLSDGDALVYRMGLGEE